MTGPLAGIRIVDCSQIVSGPMACQMLGDQGAEVIKVESPAWARARPIFPACSLPSTAASRACALI